MTADPEAAFLAQLPTVADNARLEYGIVTAVAGTDVTVALHGQPNTIPFLNSYAANVGDSVAVVRIGLYAVAIGATTRATPTVGTVTAVGANTVTVTVNGTAGLVMRYLSSYGPTNGDVVHIVDGGVVGKFATTPVPPPAPESPPPPPPPREVGTAVYVARDTASFRDGAWRTDRSAVFQGTTATGTNTGAWFYGTGPNDQLAGATIHEAYIYLNRITGSGVYAAQDAHLYLHTSADRPGGDVSRISGPRDCALAVGETAWFDMGADWGQAIVNATGRGIGIAGEPYLQLASIADDPQSGTLKLVWSR